MGMFDYIRYEMPMPNGANDVGEWQTKDLDCTMSTYIIRPDGRLIDANVRMAPKPGAPELPPLFDENYLPLYRQWWGKQEGPDIPVNLTGSVTFYGQDSKNQWWEFCAFIEKGVCFHLSQLSPE